MSRRDIPQAKTAPAADESPRPEDMRGSSGR